jgi:hypothetical protein
VTGKDVVILVDEDGRGEARAFDGFGELLDLLVAMLTRVARIRSQLPWRDVFDLVPC